MRTATWAAGATIVETRTGLRIRPTSAESPSPAGNLASTGVRFAMTPAADATTAGWSTTGAAGSTSGQGARRRKRVVSESACGPGGSPAPPSNCQRRTWRCRPGRAPRRSRGKGARAAAIGRCWGALVLSAQDKFSPAEVSVLLGVSRSSVMSRIADGSLSAVQRSGKWRLSAAAVVAFQTREAEVAAEKQRASATFADGVGLPPKPIQQRSMPSIRATREHTSG
jgi:hypothetical protein